MWLLIPSLTDFDELLCARIPCIEAPQAQHDDGIPDEIWKNDGAVNLMALIIFIAAEISEFLSYNYFPCEYSCGSNELSE